MTRRHARIGWAVAAAASTLVALAVSAAAHSALLRSDPADGARLEQAPGEVVLVFSEEPDPELSRVAVFDASGQQIDHERPAADDDDAAMLRVPLPPLDDGVYTVSWQALSSVDGHVTTGAFAFAVGEVSESEIAAPMGGDMDQRGGVGPLGVAGRWILYAGLALLFGWSISTLVVFAGRSPSPPWVLLACWLLAVGGLALITVAEANSIDASVGQLLGASAGARLVRTAAVLAALAVAVGVAIARPGRATAAGAAVLTAATMFSHVSAGHAGAPGSTQWLNLASQWLHFVFIGAWIGGLVWLLAGTRRRPDDDRVAAVRRFSTLATVAVAVVIVTGTIRALDAIGLDRLEALVNTNYGRLFLIKLGVIVPLVSLGAINKFWNVPAILRGQQHHRRLRSTVRGEVLFAAGVLAVTGFLASSPPPDDHLTADDEHADAAMPEGGITVAGNDFATTVNVELGIDPGEVGENTFTVRIADYDTDDPVDPVRVALRFTIPDRADFGPALLELEPTDEPGAWQGSGTAIAQPARWRVTVIITFADDGLEIPLDVDVGTGMEMDEPTPTDHGGT
jgi:copper transport protein